MILCATVPILLLWFVSPCGWDDSGRKPMPLVIPAKAWTCVIVPLLLVCYILWLGAPNPTFPNEGARSGFAVQASL
jgi:hypothetical protein